MSCLHSPPQSLMKSIRHMLLVKRGGRGQKIQVQSYNNMNEEEGSFLKKDSFLCTFVEAIFFYCRSACHLSSFMPASPFACTHLL